MAYGCADKLMSAKTEETSVANLRRSLRSFDGSGSSQYFSSSTTEESELTPKRKRKETNTRLPEEVSVASKLKQCKAQQDAELCTAANIQSCNEKTEKGLEIKIKQVEDHTIKIENKFLSVTSKWEPSNWQTQLMNIEKMRQSRDAPVDTMGCDKCYDETAEPKVQIV